MISVHTDALGEKLHFHKLKQIYEYQNLPVCSGVFPFIQQFTPWQKTMKYVNDTYGCNIRGQLYCLKVQYISFSKTVILQGAEIIFPSALTAEI